MEENRFGEFVWAKVVGYPYWPATIIQPGLHTPKKPENLTDRPAHLVYFCGTHEYAWIQENRIKPYTNKTFETFRSHGKKNKRLRKSIMEMDDHVLMKTENPEYVVPITSLFNHTTKKVLKPSSIVERKNSFGVIGIGVMGNFIAETLLKNGFITNVWTRTQPTQLYVNLQYTNEEHGGDLLTYNDNARDVLNSSDTVFLCISELDGIWKILNDEFGLSNQSDETMRNKGVILISCAVDSKTSKDIYEKVLEKGGQFLNVLVYRMASEERRRLVAAGNKPLYDKCLATCFPVLGTSEYHEDLSYPAKMNQVCISMKTTLVSGLAQGLALAEHLGISMEDMHTMMPCLQNVITSKINSMCNNRIDEDTFSNETSLNDTSLAVQVSEELGLSTNLIKTAREMSKKNKSKE